MGLNSVFMSNKKFWRNKKVLITGHTGFKGSWLSLWLENLESDVCGISLEPPTKPSIFNEAKIKNCLRHEIADICNFDNLKKIMNEFKPEIIIHMAAQPLVLYSYQAPLETYKTNVIGTANVLEAARLQNSVRSIVCVTTDKCYENREWAWGYREDEPMGGFDPYSSSKGCAELVASSYRSSFLKSAGIGIATARAGNVIGGGDWAPDRLVPDILKAFEGGQAAEIRNPNAIRPWQHVMEPISGYLMLAESLYKDPLNASEAWNFGPNDHDFKPVSWIADRLSKRWGGAANWISEPGNYPHEATYLKLDISKVKQRFNWKPTWNLNTSLENIVEWHKSWINGENMRNVTIEQIKKFRSTK